MSTESNAVEVFKTKVKERLDLHANQWTGKDSAVVVRALVKNLKDKDGNALIPTTHEDNVIKLACQPTGGLQLSVIKGIIAAHGAALDAETEKYIEQVVSANAFKVDLTKAGYIKDEGEDGLKGLLG